MSEWELVYPGEAVARADHEDGAYDFMSCVLYCGINAGGVMVFKLVREVEDANTKTNFRRTEDLFYHNPMFDAVTAKFLGDEYQMCLVSATENPVRVLKIRKVERASKAEPESQNEEQEPREGLSDCDLWIMWNKISPVVSIDRPDRTHRIINIEKAEIRNVAFNMIADDRQGFLVNLKDHDHVDIETRHKFATPTILKATLYEVFESINEQVPTWAEYHSMFFEFAVKPEVITATHHVVTTRLYFRD